MYTTWKGKVYGKMVVVLTSSIKEEILKLLEEDKEFRYAVAAKIGLLEILKKLEEHDRKFNEILERIDRHEKILEKHSEEMRRIWEKLEEHDRKFNEILKRLDEHDRKFNEIMERLNEHDQKFNEIMERLEEHDRKFNEIMKRLEEHDRKFNEIMEVLSKHSSILDKHSSILDRHTSMLGSLGSDIGALTEATLSRFTRDDLLNEIKARGEKVLAIKRMYVIDDYEVDLYIETDKSIYVAEVKTRPSLNDVERLARIKEYLAEKTSKNVKLLLVSLKNKTTVDIVSKCREKGIELILY